LEATAVTPNPVHEGLLKGKFQRIYLFVVNRRILTERKINPFVAFLHQSE